jgi:hypothetical protein
MITRATIISLGLIATILLSGFVEEIDFPYIKDLKSVTEWRQWADTTKPHDSKRWLKSQRVYYPTGQLKTILYVEFNGDTTSLREYSLNKNGTIDKDIWYNRFLKKWMRGDEYFYKKKETLPYMYKDKNNYKCFLAYDAGKRLISKKHVDDNNESFAAYEYTYDTAGLMIQQIEYDFFDGERQVRRIYVYEYEKNHRGQVTKKETYFVPSHESDEEVRTDKKGNQMITYYGFTAKEKTLTETIYLNEKGERMKKIEYDRKGNPEFIWTYDYEYYK